MIHHQIYIFLLLLLKASIISALIISEVADKGSSTVCGGADWIELWNDGNEQVALSGYILHDDKGILDEGAFRFPEGYTLTPNEYKVLCCDDDPTNPQFGIGGDDTITLLDDTESVVSTVGPLLNKGIFNVTYALLPDGSGYEYTMTPTPGSQNVMTPLPTAEEIKAELTARNALGTRFFGMDDNGYSVEDRMEDVLDLKLVMEEEDYLYTLEEHPWHEVYRPFTSGQLLQRSDGTEILSFTSPGRLRPKGQSTLYFPICLGVPSIPFSIDFDDTNPEQTLFGARRVYLRNKLSDRSYMREWTFHRMLARFGLPHLRTRTVRFFLNDQYIGLYDLMEAPDSDYVFHRSFPDYDIDNHALYKIKTASTSCGKQKWYNEGNITAAYERINETTPYSFERGEHRQDVPVLSDADECNDGFHDVLDTEKLDAVLAYVRNGEDCGEMLVEEGLVDRDFGVDSWDPMMKAFINEHLSNSTCAEGCVGSNLANEVDVDNFLKVFAVFSTIMHQDSPLGTGNNYYLARLAVVMDGKWYRMTWTMRQQELACKFVTRNARPEWFIGAFFVPPAKPWRTISWRALCFPTRLSTINISNTFVTLSTPFSRMKPSWTRLHNTLRRFKRRMSPDGIHTTLTTIRPSYPVRQHRGTLQDFHCWPSFALEEMTCWRNWKHWIVEPSRKRLWTPRKSALTGEAMV